MKNRIYLDNNASTSIDPRVLEVMHYELQHHYGNPSSVHSFGQESRKRLVNARQTIAAFLNAKPSEIIFTSGGTEALNMVIRGLLGKGGHVISSTVEHSAVYSTIKQLDVEATMISPGLLGAVSPDEVRAALKPNTQLIALMSVNNETGVKTDIDSIAKIAEETRVPFLVDGVAHLGKEPLIIPKGVSAMCFSGHKFHAPKGIGFAFVRNTLKFPALITGGDQEFGRRCGTENFSGIVAMGKAVELLTNELPQATQHMANLRDRLESQISQRITGVTVNGKGPRVVNTSNLSFAGVEGEILLKRLDMEGIAVSHGSACASGALEPSRILLNMGLSQEEAMSSIRFSLSRFTTEKEIDTCVDVLEKVVQQLR